MSRVYGSGTGEGLAGGQLEPGAAEVAAVLGGGGVSGEDGAVVARGRDGGVDRVRKEPLSLAVPVVALRTIECRLWILTGEGMTKLVIPVCPPGRTCILVIYH